MDSWLLITNSQFTTSVGAPAPSESFFVNSDTNSISQTDILDFIWDCQNLLREGVFTKYTSAPQKEFTLLIDASWLKARFNFHNFPEVKRINMQRSLCLINWIAYSKLKILIVATRVNPAIICQKQWMLEACTDLANSKPIKSGNFVRYARLLTFIGVETALPKKVRATTDHILVTC